MRTSTITYIINDLQAKTTRYHASHIFVFVQTSTAFNSAKKELHGKEKDSTKKPNHGKSSHLSFHFKVEEIAALKSMSTKDIPSKESSKSSNLEQLKKSSGISRV